tara:strand:- start:1175 stop:1447 length:273 start_codon:yes stop_codon:yes gene_type:complete
MAREIHSGDQLPHLFKPVNTGFRQKENDFDRLTEVGMWFFLPESEMTESQRKYNYRPQAPCRLRATRKYKTTKGHYGPNEEVGVLVQRIQ